MKLSKYHIQFIDDYLIKSKVKFIDVRIELIDHLASDFEGNNPNNKDLESFLKSKKEFISDFMKQRQKKIHWANQKKIWQHALYFFYKPKYLCYTLLIGLVMFILKDLDIKKTTLSVFIISIGLPLIVAIFIQSRESSKLKDIQSFQVIGSIMALPSLFLYFFTAFKNYLPIDGNLFYIYWFFALIFSFSGLIVFNQLLNKTVKNYNQIKLL